ncbi:expressed unknown protein [Seminavis robusta]|uniref:DUF4116 domain-containing protein n=1 Tax=Seminavis robusta TaxID=568900 RepID=A0A9N8DN03_9STRA|nr:expressed unknown protein [Seminavis robusta]|eukprot:Sro251_g099340.1 n/a (577) ;mRNA; f:60180-61910
MTDSQENKKLQEEIELLHRRENTLLQLVRRGLKKQIQIGDIPLEIQDILFPDKESSFPDKESVLHAVKNGTLRWSTLPENLKWKYDAEVVCEAFERDKMDSLVIKATRSEAYYAMTEGLHKPGILWQDLPFELKLNPDVTLGALRTRQGPALNCIPPQFQNCFSFLSVAILFEKLSLEEVPTEVLQKDPELALLGVQMGEFLAADCPILTPEVLRRAVNESKLEWEDLPFALQQDLGFALGITKTEILQQMLQSCPQLWNHQEFWLKVTKQTYVSRVQMQHISLELRSNSEFMIELCVNCAAAYALVDEDLSSSRDFLEQILQGNGCVIKYLSHELQELHIDLIIQALPSIRVECKKENGLGRILARALSPAIWTQRDFVLKWVQAGLSLPSNLPDQQLEILEQDQEICLENVIAQKAFEYRFGQQYTGDPAFVLKVVKHHPFLYTQATGSAKICLQVMAAAFAGCPEIAYRALADLPFKEQTNLVRRLQKYIHNELEPYSTFCSCVLGNMISTQSMASTGTSLTLLNQGLETSLRYKKLLAEYLGIPRGSDLKRLLRARDNVHKATGTRYCPLVS